MVVMEKNGKDQRKEKVTNGELLSRINKTFYMKERKKGSIMCIGRTITVSLFLKVR